MTKEVAKSQLKDKAIENARLMKENKVDETVIMQVTGLSIEEIKSL